MMNWKETLIKTLNSCLVALNSWMGEQIKNGTSRGEIEAFIAGQMGVMMAICENFDLELIGIVDKQIVMIVAPEHIDAIKEEFGEGEIFRFNFWEDIGKESEESGKQEYEVMIEMLGNVDDEYLH